MATSNESHHEERYVGDVDDAFGPEGPPRATASPKTRETKEHKHKRGLLAKLPKIRSKSKDKSGSKEQLHPVGYSPDGESNQPPKKHRGGVLERLKRFGSKDNLDDVHYGSSEAEPEGGGGSKPKKKDPSEADRRKHKRKTRKDTEEEKENKEMAKRRKEEDKKQKETRKHKKKSSPSIGSLSEDEAFIKAFVAVTNQYRKHHGVHRLKVNQELVLLARECALAMAKEKDVDKQMQELGCSIYCKKIYGEKLHRLNADTIVDKWYSEVKLFDFSEPEKTYHKAENFTRLIWKDTKEIGVSKVASEDNEVVIVAAFFNPAGNIPGKFRTHVPPLGGFPKAGDESSSDSEHSVDEMRRYSSNYLYDKNEKPHKKGLFGNVFRRFRKTSTSEEEDKRKEKHLGNGLMIKKQGKYNVDSEFRNYVDERESGIITKHAETISDTIYNVNDLQDQPTYEKDSYPKLDLDLHADLEKYNGQKEMNFVVNLPDEARTSIVSTDTSSECPKLLSRVSISSEKEKTFRLIDTTPKSTVMNEADVKQLDYNGILTKMETSISSKRSSSSSNVSDDEKKNHSQLETGEKSIDESESRINTTLNSHEVVEKSTDVLTQESAIPGIFSKMKFVPSKKKSSSSSSLSEDETPQLADVTSVNIKSETSTEAKRPGILKRIKDTVTRRDSDSSSSDEEQKNIEHLRPHETTSHEKFVKVKNEVHHRASYLSISEDERKVIEEAQKFTEQSKIVDISVIRRDSSSSSDDEQKGKIPETKHESVENAPIASNIIDSQSIFSKVKGVITRQDSISSSSSTDNENDHLEDVLPTIVKSDASTEAKRPEILKRIKDTVTRRDSDSSSSDEEQKNIEHLRPHETTSHEKFVKVKNEVHHRASYLSISEDERKVIEEAQKFTEQSKIVDISVIRRDSSSSSDDEQKGKIPETKHESVENAPIASNIIDSQSIFSKGKGVITRQDSISSSSSTDNENDHLEDVLPTIVKSDASTEAKRPGILKRIKDSVTRRDSGSSSSDEEQKNIEHLRPHETTSHEKFVKVKNEVHHRASYLSISEDERKVIEKAQKFTEQSKIVDISVIRRDSSSSSDDEQKGKIPETRHESVENAPIASNIIDSQSIFSKVKGVITRQDSISSSSSTDNENDHLEDVLPTIVKSDASTEAKRPGILKRIKDSVTRRDSGSSSSDEEQKNIEHLRPHETTSHEKFVKVKNEVHHRASNSSISEDEKKVIALAPKCTEQSKIVDISVIRRDSSSSSDDEQKDKIPEKKHESVENAPIASNIIDSQSIFSKVKGVITRQDSISSSSSTDNEKDHLEDVLPTIVKSDASTEAKRPGILKRIKDSVTRRDSGSSSSDEEQKNIEHLRPHKTTSYEKFVKVKNEVHHRASNSSISEDKKKVITEAPKCTEQSKIVDISVIRRDSSSSSDDEQKDKIPEKKHESVENAPIASNIIDSQSIFSKVKGVITRQDSISSSSSTDNEKDYLEDVLPTIVKSDASTEAKRPGILKRIKDSVTRRDSGSSFSDEEQKNIEHLRPHETTSHEKFVKVKNEVHHRAINSSISEDEKKVITEAPKRTEQSKIADISVIRRDSSSSSDAEQKDKIPEKKYESVENAPIASNIIDSQSIFSKMKGVITRQDSISSSSSTDNEKDHLEDVLPTILKSDASTEAKRPGILKRIKDSVTRRDSGSSSSDEEQKNIEHLRPHETTSHEKFVKVKNEVHHRASNSSISEDEKKVIALAPKCTEQSKIVDISVIRRDSSSSSDAEQKDKIPEKKYESVENAPIASNIIDSQSIFSKVKGVITRQDSISSSSSTDKEKDHLEDVLPTIVKSDASTEAKRPGILKRIIDSVTRRDSGSSSSDEEQKNIEHLRPHETTSHEKFVKVKNEVHHRASNSSISEDEKKVITQAPKCTEQSKIVDISVIRRESSSSSDDEQKDKIPEKKHESVENAPIASNIIDSQSIFSKVKGVITRQDSISSSSSTDNEKDYLEDVLPTIVKSDASTEAKRPGILKRIKDSVTRRDSGSSSSDEEQKNIEHLRPHETTSHEKFVKVKNEVHHRAINSSISEDEKKVITEAPKCTEQSKIADISVIRRDSSSSSDAEQKDKIPEKKYESVENAPIASNIIDSQSIFSKMKGVITRQDSISSSSSTDNEKDHLEDVLPTILKSDASTEAKRPGILKRIKDSVTRRDSGSSSSDEEQKNIEHLRPHETTSHEKFVKVKNEVHHRASNSSISEDEKKVIALAPKCTEQSKIVDISVIRRDSSSSSDAEQKDKIPEKKYESVENAPIASNIIDSQSIFSKVKGVITRQDSISSSSSTDNEKDHLEDVLPTILKSDASTEAKRPGILKRIKDSVTRRDSGSSSSDEEQKNIEHLRPHKTTSHEKFVKVKNEVHHRAINSSISEDEKKVITEAPKCTEQSKIVDISVLRRDSRSSSDDEQKDKIPEKKHENVENAPIASNIIDSQSIFSKVKGVITRQDSISSSSSTDNEKDHLEDVLPTILKSDASTEAKRPGILKRIKDSVTRRDSGSSSSDEEQKNIEHLRPHETTSHEKFVKVKNEVHHRAINSSISEDEKKVITEAPKCTEQSKIVDISVLRRDSRSSSDDEQKDKIPEKKHENVERKSDFESSSLSDDNHGAKKLTVVKKIKKKFESRGTKSRSSDDERNEVNFAVVGYDNTRKLSATDAQFFQNKFNWSTCNFINNHRLQHNALPLNLDLELCRVAKERANSLSKLEKNDDKHNFGEVLDIHPINSLSSKESARRVVNNWYKTIEYYKYGSMNDAVLRKSADFTQLVWRNSKYLGIGMATNIAENKVYVVALFDPPGNQIGGYHNQVHLIRRASGIKLRKDSSSSSDDESDIRRHRKPVKEVAVDKKKS